MGRTSKRADGLREKKVMINGKRYSIYAKTELEMLQKIEEKRQEIEHASFKVVKDMTVREYADRWIENRRNAVTSTTIRSHQIKLKRICKTEIDRAGHLFGDLMLTEVEPDHVRELQHRLERDGFHSSTVNTSVSEIRSVFKDAVVDRIITFNPAAGIKPIKRTEEEARDKNHRALSDEEIKTFFEAAKGTWYYDLYVFLIQTGCRVGEAGALMYDDVSDGIVSIKRSVTRSEYGDYEIGRTAKTKSGIRDIPLNELAKEALEEQKRFNFESLGEEAANKDPRYFRNTKGGVVGCHPVNVAIRTICKKTGIENFSTHAFRHTFATRAIMSGMMPKTLQEILGHSDINLTMNLYSHVMPSTKIEEMGNVHIEI